MNVIGIGTDIVEIARIAKMIDRHGENFIGKVFTLEEIRYSTGRAAAVQHFAARWAAKEAALKALGTGWAKGIKWTDIGIQNEGSGKPRLILFNRAKEVAKEIGIEEVLISISHDKSQAIAFAIATGNLIN